MIVLKKEEIKEEDIIGNYYIIEEEYVYTIYELLGSNDRYVLLKFIERTKSKY